MQNPITVLLLRAYGDFIIAVHLASKNTLSTTITLVASKHLEPLYLAISPTLPPNVSIRFYDFGIHHNLMGCFTDRYLFHPQSFREMYRLRNYIRHHPVSEPYYLEQEKRSLLLGLITGYSFRHIIAAQHVYRGYADFFLASLDALENISFDLNQQGLKVLVLPDARQAKRKISDDIIEKVKTAFQKNESIINVALFGKTGNKLNGDTIVYKDFSALIQLIRESDLVIGGDSMPIHIAQLMGKPHYILYPAYVKDQFFTPFSLKHKSYFTFEALRARKSFFPDEA